MIKKIYKEMPHIDYGKGKIIDLELENFKTSEEIINFIESILLGDEFKDRHGNIIKLDSRREKIKFLNNLVNDIIFKNIVKNKFSENEKKLINIILKGFVNV